MYYIDNVLYIHSLCIMLLKLLSKLTKHFSATVQMQKGTYTG